MITQEDVKRLFDYSDGNLIWKVKASQMKPGDAAGCKRYKDEYKVVRVNRKLFLIHRIIWLWHYGYLPENFIDHIDRDKANNRIENLREVSSQCNVVNSSIHSTNTSGVKGVSWSKVANKWHAYLEHNGKRIHLGLFDRFIAAVQARRNKEVSLGWDDCDYRSSAKEFLEVAV